jgi:hypothetical protein
MKKMIEMFKGDKGEISSKRVVGIIGAIVLFSAMVLNIFYPKEISPSPDLIDAVKWVVIGALGITGAEKFANKNEQG